jgi:hypothetical protein
MSQIHVPERPALALPRRKWRRRFLLGILIVVPLCLVAVGMPLIYFVLASDRELREAIAEADALDPGWRLQELEAKRAIIPDEQNSALVLMSAQSLLPANWPFFWHHQQPPEMSERSRQEVRNLQQSLLNLQPGVLLEERQTRSLREELLRAGDALGIVKKVATLRTGRYPGQNNGLATMKMGHLVSYDALLRAQDNDPGGALESCRAILSCSRALGDEVGIFSMLVRLGLNRLATERIEQTLALGEPPESVLSSLQHDLERQVEEPLLLIMARGERAWLDHVLCAAQEGDLEPVRERLLAPGRSHPLLQVFHVPGMAKSIRAAVLKSNSEFVEIAKLPLEQQIVRIKELEAAEKDLPALARNLLLHSRATIAADFHRERTKLRCAIVMIAVEHYRRANNRWPGSLTDLVPAHLQEVPLDPYDGAPLRYRRFDEGVVVYSVGPDGQDNGGMLDKVATTAGTDLGFRLWDVQGRRQPPNPPAK